MQRSQQCLLAVCSVKSGNAERGNDLAWVNCDIEELRDATNEAQQQYH